VLESTEVSVSELLVQLAERVHESFSAFFLLTLHLDTQNPKLQEAPSLKLWRALRALSWRDIKERPRRRLCEVGLLLLARSATHFQQPPS
jgi:hypothetical protein